MGFRTRRLADTARPQTPDVALGPASARTLGRSFTSALEVSEQLLAVGDLVLASTSQSVHRLHPSFSDGTISLPSVPCSLPMPWPSSCRCTNSPSQPPHQRRTSKLTAPATRFLSPGSTYLTEPARLTAHAGSFLKLLEKDERKPPNLSQHQPLCRRHCHETLGECDRHVRCS